MKITDDGLRLEAHVPLATADEREAFRLEHLTHGAYVDSEGNLICDSCETIWFTREGFLRHVPYEGLGTVRDGITAEGLAAKERALVRALGLGAAEAMGGSEEERRRSQELLDEYLAEGRGGSDGEKDENPELSGQLPAVDASPHASSEALAPQSSSRPSGGNPFLED